MCYVIEPDQYDIPYLTYITSIDSPGEIYSIGINRSLAIKMKFVKIIVHSKKSLPTISKRFSIYTYVSQRNGTLFKVRFNRHFVHYLGYPYDKFTCASVRGVYQQCMESCAMNKSIEKFNRIVHDLDVVKKYDFKHMSKSQVSMVGKIPGIISSGSKYLGYLPRYLLEVNTFVQGIGYYPHLRVFTAVNTRGIYFQNFLSYRSGMEQFLVKLILYLMNVLIYVTKRIVT